MIRLNGYSVRRRDQVTKGYAKRHRKLGLDAQADLVVTKIIGTRQAFDPKQHKVHEGLVAQAAGVPQREEWEEELHSTERTMTTHANRWLLWGLFVFLLAVEFLASIQLLGAQGLENPERNILGAATACILFYLTYEAATKSRQDKKDRWYYVLLSGIGMLVVSITFLRAEETSVEGAQWWWNLGSSLFMVGITLGPSLLAKKVFSLLLPVLELHRNRRRLKRLLRTAQRVQHRARKKIEQLILRDEWWVQEKEQITALYLLTYRETIPSRVRSPYQ